MHGLRWYGVRSRNVALKKRNARQKLLFESQRPPAQIADTKGVKGSQSSSISMCCQPGAPRVVYLPRRALTIVCSSSEIVLLMVMMLSVHMYSSNSNADLCR